MRLILHIWKQASGAPDGKFERYELDDIDKDMSFLEMLDYLNETLQEQDKEPVVFDSDCREGICGTCSLVINGYAHGPGNRSATCQKYMRDYKDGEEIWIEPFRGGAFKVVKDLMTDRSALDRIIQAGGYISVPTGPKPEPNANPIAADDAERAMDAAACIGCGACVAQCPNGSAMLFTAAKVSHLGQLPQGQPERDQRVVNMVEQHEEEGFGSCTNHAECQAACPKGISIDFIGQLNRDYNRAMVFHPHEKRGMLANQ